MSENAGYWRRYARTSRNMVVFLALGTAFQLGLAAYGIWVGKYINALGCVGFGTWAALTCWRYELDRRFCSRAAEAAEDREAARAATEDVKANGTVAWDEIKADLEL